VLRAKTKAQVTRRNSQYEKRLSSILQAASKVIAKDGFEGASVRDVAARAKIGLSGIYYYFRNKDELLYLLQRHTFETLVKSLLVKLEKAKTPDERLKAVVENHFEFFAGNMDELKVCVHEIGSLSGKYYQEVLKIRQDYHKLVRSIVAESVGKSKQKTDLATLYLFGSMNWTYMWYDPKKNKSVDMLSKNLLDLFLNGVKPS